MQYVKEKYTIAAEQCNEMAVIFKPTPRTRRILDMFVVY